MNSHLLLLQSITLYFCIALVSAAPLTSENAAWNVNFEAAHVPHQYYGEWPGHTYFPSPEDWRSIPIYQLVTDRFADGDPRNNEAPGMEGFDVRDMTFRHGGDFAGLRQKLHYIKGLGCKGVWISPIFQNGDNFYHQYAQHDFTLLDKRLGTLEELRDLTTAAHALGMYVIIDVVMNHMGDEFYFEGHQYESTPFRWHEDNGEREYRLLPRRAESQLHDTPAGRQPYMDFWYNNTWDPQAQYQGPVYGQYGEAGVDTGHGTYDGSDFHHNGDLGNYYKIWEIHVGKIYGTMDDLRLEHPRVSDKYIAMTKALISSTDVDAFRVDTPMQVPLPFYKRWAPAIRAHANSLGKTNFMIFGEFYVTPARYATMTGRGRDQTMWGQERFLDGPATMKGGIVYSYYWYMFTAMVHGDAQYADGFPLAYQKENEMIDTYDPNTNRKEYSMLNFCNNHDNWRLQSMAGKAEFRMCLVVITFWPGIPLHYAGDEQDLDTPGSALDGWAREELSASLAWQAVRTGPEGNPADRDNFDMTSETYRFIQRLNALRSAYFQSFGSEACDELQTPAEATPDVLVFFRSCPGMDQVAVVANFHKTLNRSVAFTAPWSQGTHLRDAVAADSPLEVVVDAAGQVSLQLPPLTAIVLADGPRKQLPPALVAVSPAHGSVVEWLDNAAGHGFGEGNPLQRASAMSVLAAPLEEREIAEIRANFPDFAGDVPEEAKYWSCGDLELFFGSGGQLRPRETAKAGAPSCALLSRLRQRLAEDAVDEPTAEYRSFCRHLRERGESPQSLPSASSCSEAPRVGKPPDLLKAPAVVRCPKDWKAQKWGLDFWRREYGCEWWKVRARAPRFQDDRKAADSFALAATVAEYVDYVRVVQKMDPTCKEENMLAFPRVSLDSWCPFAGAAKPLFDSCWRALRPDGVKDLSVRWMKLFCATFNLDWVEFIARFFKVTLSAAGAISRLHRENHNAHAWFSQIEGRRLFFLFPPTDSKCLYEEIGQPFPDPEGYAATVSPVDIFHPSQKKHPSFAEAKAQAALLEPGEVLLLPMGWWYYSVALTPSVTLHHPFWNLENRAHMVSELKEAFLDEQMPPEMKELSSRHLTVLHEHIVDDVDSDMDDN